MGRRHGFWTALLAAILLAMTLASGPAAAQSLDALRASGAVGERYDGLAAVRDPGASAQVRGLVDQVNAKRRQIYAQRAGQQGVPADQVGRVYAKEILQKAPPGTWFLNEAGQWVRK
jgi:uncharacterized protein YdbL (DUF1318 family)